MVLKKEKIIMDIDNTIKKSLKEYFWPKNRSDLKVRVVLAFSFLILAKLFQVFIPFLYKFSVDRLSTPQQWVFVPGLLVAAYCLARVLSQVFTEIKDVIFVHVSQFAVRRTVVKTFEHLHTLSLKFHLERKTGSVARALERGAQGIEYILTFLLFTIIPTLCEILFVTIVLYVKYKIWVSLITFLTILAYIVFTLMVSQWRTEHRRLTNDADSDAAGKAVDSLINYETVKYFTNETLEVSRFDQSRLTYQGAMIKAQNSLALLNIGQGSIIAIGLFLIMFLASKEVVTGHMTVGDFVLVNTFLIQLYIPLNFLGFVYRQMKQSLTDMETMNTLLNTDPDVSDSPHAQPLLIKKGEVVFDQVGFYYDERTEVLKNISFKVPAGASVAIVGSSGSGKSTLSRLLFRFYDAISGQILIDGQDIKHVTQSSLRQQIGIVPQDTVLFNDTIFYNIQYGFKQASEEQVIQAAKLAQIHDFIRQLPDGYLTKVGERGLKLSGGEKQRIAIARMLLKNPPIVIFDEATSALDTQTEKEIQHALTAASQSKTTLIIAHRLSTIVHCKEILVLEKGHIIEKGSHEELLEKKGHYALLWQNQQQDKP